ncbi:hypothetical protein V9T40_002059 [Parthenolecanium corni]|uniref:Uncharacterized protein n=1 Tax=Parthenolecanium corni TaxID=536013 RepID=A0AAN9Y3G7_9HEMI
MQPNPSKQDFFRQSIMNQNGGDQPQHPIIPPPKQMESGTSAPQCRMSIANSIDGDVHDMHNLHTPLSTSSKNLSLHANSLVQSFEMVDQIKYSPDHSNRGHPTLPGLAKPTQPAPSTPEESNQRAEVSRYRYTITASMEMVHMTQRMLKDKSHPPNMDKLEVHRDMMVLYLATLKTKPIALTQAEFDEALPVVHTVQMCVFNVNMYIMKKAHRQPPELADIATTSPPQRNELNNITKKKIDHFVKVILDIDHRWKKVDMVLRENNDKICYHERQRESMIIDREDIRREMKAIDSALKRELYMDLAQFRPRYMNKAQTQPPRTYTSSGKQIKPPHTRTVHMVPNNTVSSSDSPSPPPPPITSPPPLQ